MQYNTKQHLDGTGHPPTSGINSMD